MSCRDHPRRSGRASERRTRRGHQASPVLGLSSSEAAARLARDGPNVLVAERGAHRFKRLLGPLADPMVALLLLAAPTYLLIGETTDADRGVRRARPDRRGRLAARVASRTHPRPAPPAQRPHGHGRARRHRERRSRSKRWSSATSCASTKATSCPPTPPSSSSPSCSSTNRRSPASRCRPASRPAPTVTSRWCGPVPPSCRDEPWRGSAPRHRHPVRADRHAGGGRTVAAHAAAAGLARLVRALAVLAAVFCAAVIGAELLHGDGWGDAVIAGVSLAIAAIPEEFSMIYTPLPRAGAWRLAQERTLVRRLPAVETLGSTTVICTDKTGTLTHGRLAVAGLWTAGGAPRRRHAHRCRGRTARGGRARLRAPSPTTPSTWPSSTTPAATTSTPPPCTPEGSTGLAVRPTDKYLTHVWTPVATGRTRVPPPKAPSKASSPTPMPPSELRAGAVAANERAQRRRHARHRRRGRAGPADLDEPRRRRGATAPAGLVAFSDPVREGVAEAPRRVPAAGVRVVMITGDHPATAHAVAEGLGLPHESGGTDVIATGDDLDAAATGGRLDDLVATANVFARTRPEQKHRPRRRPPPPRARSWP